MNEIVIVPLHKRPAFALACLTRLYQAAAEDKSLRFYLTIDAAPSAAVVNLAERFAKQTGHHRTEIVKRLRTYRGNSYNLLSAYSETVNSGADLIHLVEEDVLVGKDYFDYHRQVREVVPDAFSVCACRNQLWPLDQGPPPEEDAVYLQRAYQSIGVSFTPEKLRLVVEHAVGSFYTNPLAYIRRHFPASSLKDAYREQDGLIFRIVEKRQEFTAYPCVPRAYHCGFTGYNRSGLTLSGSYEDQARRIMQMNGDELNQHARSYRDYETVDLDGDRKPIARTVKWF